MALPTTKSPLTTVLFQESTLTECKILLENLKTGWESYFESMTGEALNNLIIFTSPIDNSKRSIIASDTIFHIVYHSYYHHRQIITLLKGNIEQLPLLILCLLAVKKFKNK